MKPTNPYQPAFESGQRAQESAKLPLSFPLFAVLDILAGAAIAFISFATWFGAENRTFASLFVGIQVITALLLVFFLIATAITLSSDQRSAQKLFLVSQCIVAFAVFFTYASLMYVLIETWGVSNMMWKGGDPQSVTILTLIYLVVQTLAAIPVFILFRNRPSPNLVDHQNSQPE